MIDLQPYRLPLAPMPAAANRVHAQGIAREEFPALEQLVSSRLDAGERYPDGVRRAPDGRALITCTTELPGVTSAMIDWWFGWHLTDSARYRLWHPVAHVRAQVKEDRSHLPDDRARYIGNVSYVDEYIGRSLHRLAIAFHEPSSFGLDGARLDALGGTAVCARTSDRVLRSEGGRLVHLILPGAEGCTMYSAFLLGEIENQLPLIGPLITRLVNRAATRTRVIGDRFLLDLFQHCAEEMNHLAKFLPQLYRDVTGDRPHVRHSLVVPRGSNADAQPAALETAGRRREQS